MITRWRSSYGRVFPQEALSAGEYMILTGKAPLLGHSIGVQFSTLVAFGQAPRSCQNTSVLCPGRENVESEMG